MVERLIGVDAVADALGVSKRQVWRLRDMDRMPRPVCIGKSVRWREGELSDWIAAGCPDPRRTQGGR